MLSTKQAMMEFLKHLFNLLDTLSNLWNLCVDFGYQYVQQPLHHSKYLEELNKVIEVIFLDVENLKSDNYSWQCSE